MASRERDDAMAGLLRRGFESGTETGEDCPAPDIVAAYFERSLDADETVRCELHFSRCARCREELAALARADEAAATSSEKPRSAPRASWLWDWRWIAPVAAVLIVAAVWATRRPTLTRIAEHPTQAPVAVTSQPAAPQSAVAQIAPTPQPAKPTLSSSAGRAIPPKKIAAQPEGNAQLKKEEVSPPGKSAALQPPASVQDLPLNGRNFVQQEALTKSGNMRTDSLAHEKNSADAGDAGGATAQSAAPTTAAARPMAAQAPGAAGGFAAGVAGGVISGSAAGAPKDVKAKQVELPTAANQYTAQSIAAQTVEQLNSEPLIRTPDAKILWRLASGGFVERSEDGGATWHGQLPNVNARLVAGFAPSATVCWLVGDNGTILLTTDAVHWRTVPPPERADFAAVTALDADSAIITVADGRKFITNNRGRNWAPAP
jgi:hypothetical protein